LKGKFVTVVLAPFKVRGDYTGQIKRIKKDKISGIVYRKKVIPYES